MCRGADQKTFRLPAPIFAWSRRFTTVARVVENKLEKAELERAEAKNKLDKAERELESAKSELSELKEMRKRGEPVDDAAFARADKTVERAIDFFNRADDNFKGANELLTKLLSDANGACSCMCGRSLL